MLAHEQSVAIRQAGMKRARRLNPQRCRRGKCHDSDARSVLLCEYHSPLAEPYQPDRTEIPAVSMDSVITVVFTDR